MLASASSRASLLFLLVAGLLLVEAKSAIDKAFCGDLDCYTILNVTSDATRGEIKRGYHQMSLKYHPDKVSNAYALLTDLNERKSYDMWVDAGIG
ncbi:hypothetical protein T484DRAFT_1829517 [Baffinella frigidus]|nr:hypothetical protein T484DRAFT_1829517 [Cryptophyta sp. CCMP2293]